MDSKLQHYIQRTPGYFWSLEDGGEVIAGSNGGGTIVYTPLLLQTLEFILPHGWPPLGALLLAFAATNANSNVTDLLSHVRASCSRMAKGNRTEPAYIKEAEPLLHLLQKLPAHYRTGTARMQLMQVLFCKSHNRLGVERISHWLPMLRQTGLQATPMPGGPEDEQRDLFFRRVDKDFQCLSLLAQKFRNEAGILDALSGLPEIKEEPELPELPVAGNAAPPTDWLEALLQHPETFQAGALLQHLWAGLSVPVLFSLPEEQPAGGAADLTNKGSFDRMLLSEYANDDMVLLSRLANNEVLYLHPEASHASDDAEYTVLIDVSLKNWGNCRVLGYALALAIAKHPRVKDAIHIQAVGLHNFPVAYGNVEEVITGMRRLDTGLHAAAGISGYLASQPDNKKQQLLFISSEEAAGHIEVQKVISDHYHRFVCWIMVTATGQVSVYRKVQKSRKLLQQMTLPLDILWQKKLPAKPVAPRPVAPLSEEQVSAAATYPILCPADNNIKKLLGKLGDYWIVTGTKQLFHACDYKDKRGWEWMPYKIPDNSSLFDLCVNEQGDKILLCFAAQGKKVGLLNLRTGNCDMLDFPEWQLSSHPQFFHIAHTFYYIKGDGCWTIQPGPQPAIHRRHAEADMVQHYNDYEKYLTELGDTFNKVGAKPWMKKLKSLYINTEGQLVLNDSHVLVLNHRGVIKWLQVSAERKRSAVDAIYYENENLFVFPDGSNVEVSNKGFVILKMVKPDIEELYDVIAPSQQIANKMEYLKKYSDNGRIDSSLSEIVHLIGDKPRVVSTFSSLLKAEAYIMQFSKTNIVLEAVKVQSHQDVYIPLVIDTALAIATPHYFAGNEYYLPYNHKSVVVRDSADLYKRTVNYFTSQIIRHGA
ncbi:hypothetical protein GCM10011379_22530 [Filimonas zeae]|uniref:MoxR-vWA-beta-propeller ternary system domain-containing protein n=2 Tax=Filimonas zeae TaxID=1737353 RepID=A0A917IYS0_9BACT|nr:hypothetical protein GCM10011379_22530 [Filimonas zeae]